VNDSRDLHKQCTTSHKHRDPWFEKLNAGVILTTMLLLIRDLEELFLFGIIVRDMLKAQNISLY